MRMPGRGASCPGVGRPGSGALPLPTSRSFGRSAGALCPLAVGAGGAGVGTSHQPHSLRPLASWLFALWGRHEGAWGGAPVAWVWGVRGRALSLPRPSVLWGVRPGPSTHWLWVRGVRAWGPVTNPTACALWRAGFVRCGGGTRAPGGGRLLPWCGASGVGRSPTPDLSFFRACGRGPLPTGRGCGVRARGPGCPWHILLCRGSLCVVRASQVLGTRQPLWLGSCPRAVVVAGGVPLWRASWPRVGALHLVWSGRSRCSVRLSRRRGAFPQSGGCRPRFY